MKQAQDYLKVMNNIFHYMTSFSMDNAFSISWQSTQLSTAVKLDGYSL